MRGVGNGGLHKREIRRARREHNIDLADQIKEHPHRFCMYHVSSKGITRENIGALNHQHRHPHVGAAGDMPGVLPR